VEHEKIKEAAPFSRVSLIKKRRDGEISDQKEEEMRVRPKRLGYVLDVGEGENVGRVRKGFVARQRRKIIRQADQRLRSFCLAVFFFFSPLSAEKKSGSPCAKLFMEGRVTVKSQPNARG
jgi:hypothetical protein